MKDKNNKSNNSKRRKSSNSCDRNGKNRSNSNSNKMKIITSSPIHRFYRCNNRCISNNINLNLNLKHKHRQYFTNSNNSDIVNGKRLLKRNLTTKIIEITNIPNTTNTVTTSLRLP